MRAEDKLTEMRELLSYDPETGVFTWLKSRGGILAGTPAGSRQRKGYMRIRIWGREWSAHRLAWLFVHGFMTELQIDHMDGNGCNNAIRNLRAVDNSTNQQNRRRACSNSKTGVLGVTHERSRFKATIGVNRRQVYLGTFDTPQEAYEAYVSAKRRLHAAGNTL